MDVRDEQSVKACIDRAVEEIELPTIVVNNAAGNFISPFEGYPQTRSVQLSILF